MNSLPEPLPEALKQKARPGPNTGPKGVLADYEFAKQNLRNVRLIEKVRRERALDRLSKGVQRISVNQGSEDKDNDKDKKAEKKKDKEDDEEDDEEEEDEEDDEYFKQYKLQRIRSIQNSLPRYGQYSRVDYNEMASMIKNENEYVYIVIHLYQNSVEACVRLNEAFEELAKQFVHVHFIRIRSTDAISNYSTVGLPTLLIYRNAKLVHTFIRCQENIGKKIDELTVARFLSSHKILNLPGEEVVQSLTKQSAQKNDDDDDDNDNKQ